jgi:type IV pilus assembly protein PilQ
VKVTLPAGSAGAAPAAAAETPAAQPAAKAAEPAQARASRPVVIQTVAVARGKGGINVEILGTGAMTPKAMKLTGPDRVVIDVPNAVPLRKREIAVNSGDVKSIRVARYQVDPPVTRVVVDLAANKDFEVVPTGRKLTVKLRPAAEVAQPAPAAPATPAAAVEVAGTTPAAPQPPKQEAASAAPETTPAPAATPTQQGAVAQSFVVVEPQYKPKVKTAEAKQPEMTPATRAQDAASKFGTPQQEVPLINVPQPSAALMPSTAAITAAVQQQAGSAAPQAAGAAAGRPKFTGEPISVNLKDVDLKDFFRLIHEISGLNIVLDPNVKGTLTLVLDNVPWDQALDIVLKNNGLQKDLDGNVLRIATLDTMRKEADAQRAQIEAKALADPKITVTRVLSYAHSKDVVPVIKKFLSQRGEIISDDRINALIIQDIPGVFPAVDRLLAQLDRKTPEVEIEARVIAATRNFARDIGMQLGFGWGNNMSAVGGVPAAGNSPLTIAGLTPSYLTNAGTIPLFSNLPAVTTTSGLSFVNANNTYRLDAILSMSEDRGLLKILSRPRVVTQNNITAVVKQGVRIPVVTLAQLGGPPTTTYVDAFLRLTVTPQITAESTIFLAVDVENTTPDFGHQVQGNPTLLTQQAVTQVLVSDGGTVVIGGVIQTQNSVTIQQVPLLGSIPGLGNLFKRRGVSTSTQELIFFITPKIIQT